MMTMKCSVQGCEIPRKLYHTMCIDCATKASKQSTILSASAPGWLDCECGMTFEEVHRSQHVCIKKDHCVTCEVRVREGLKFCDTCFGLLSSEEQMGSLKDEIDGRVQKIKSRLRSKPCCAKCNAEVQYGMQYCRDCFGIETEKDMVNHPSHYTSHPSGVECITITEHMGFNLGNALKYIWRADEKGKAIEDLEKAEFYIKREIAKRQKKES